MASNRFTNIHSHIFTSTEVPDYFLKTIIGNDWIARNLNSLFQKKMTLNAMKPILWAMKAISPNYRNSIERYIEFIQIGASSTQGEIFDREASAYSGIGNYRIVVLTQMLDYLDVNSKSNHKRIQTQVEEVVQLKRDANYQKRLYPFLSVDPRMTFMEPIDWVQKYISKDMGFYGIKMYPAYGFFPFDARLDPVYEWAEKYEVPIMTHCTRGGSWYLGTFDSVLNKGGFMAPGLNEDHASMTKIRGRINSLIADKDKHKNNKYWCNIFGHIENYEPVLAKYPNLKICFAHMGGATEILRPKKDKSYPKYFDDNWYEMILDKLANHKNTYTDISYTLSNEKAMARIKSDYVDKDFLKYKVLYGTDFFLTQVEKKGDEPNMLSTFLQLFDQASIQKIAYDNNENYLKSKIHPTP